MWRCFNISCENVNCISPQPIQVFIYSHLHQQYGTCPLHLIYILLEFTLWTVANPTPKVWSFVQISLLYSDCYKNDVYSVWSIPVKLYRLTFLLSICVNVIQQTIRNVLLHFQLSDSMDALLLLSNINSIVYFWFTFNFCLPSVVFLLHLGMTYVHFILHFFCCFFSHHPLRPPPSLFRNLCIPFSLSIFYYLAI